MNNQTTVEVTETLPYINDQGDLVIPFDCPERYHYWKNGALTLSKILEELNAPPVIIAKYTKSPGQ
jgi:hypothetical protein